MKKILTPDYLPFLTLTGGLLGFLCRFRTFGAGPNSEALYTPQPVAWTLLWLVSALTVAGIVLGCRGMVTGTLHEHSYPRSLTSAIGTVAGAVGILSVSLPLLTAGADRLSLIGGILGTLSGVCLFVVAVLRHQGKQPHFLLHTPACLFLAVHLFVTCRGWSDLSQLGLFLIPFLALTTLMLASHRKVTFDVDLGDRKNSVFWSLTAAYLCIVSMADQSQLLFFGCMTVWMLADLPSLRPIPAETDLSAVETE